LREAEKLCHATNVAIQAPEHLLAGALLVLRESGGEGIPERPALEAAVLAIHGASDEPLNAQVMWGSAVREALNLTAGSVAAAGGTEIDARIIAMGLVESGEVNPMFYAAAGTAKAALLGAITDGLKGD
jgi:hypothetical protein